MPTVFRHRKLIALVCVAAVVLAAFAASTSDVFHFILVPVDPLFACVVPGPVILVDQHGVLSIVYLETLESRGPPAV